ncbi:MAG: TylF/MycF/NovP-related O-methyltransferase [Burkholderiales bacterium]
MAANQTGAMSVVDAVAKANELYAARRWAELEGLVNAILGSVADPVPLPTKSASYYARQLLIESVYRQGRIEEAVTRFGELLSLTAERLPAEFEALYLDGLRRTGTLPLPLARMPRQFALVRLFEGTPAPTGAVAECGCFRGMSSYLLCGATRWHRPDFRGEDYHVFDSFAGLSAPGAKDAVAASDAQSERVRGMTTAGAFAASLDDVRRNLAEFPAIEFHPGWLPESLAGAAERTYRFVHLDVDLHAPTAGALAYFHPRLAPGGRIVCDDYSWPGARQAIDEFAADAGIRINTTPAGQAWLERERDAA